MNHIKKLSSQLQIKSIINPKEIVLKRVSGNKKHNSTAGKIYVSSEWIGKEVLVILK